MGARAKREDLGYRIESGAAEYLTEIHGTPPVLLIEDLWAIGYQGGVVRPVAAGAIVWEQGHDGSPEENWPEDGKEVAPVER